MIDALAASVLGTDGVEVKPVLGAGLALDEEEPAVGAPERRTEVLVLVLVEVSPGDGRSLDIGDADAYLRVVVAALWIAGHPDRTSSRRDSLERNCSTGLMGVGQPHTAAVIVFRV